ncbi:MAG: type II toxin-antitoxin system MqsR family toxin [Selenomonadaceae bacterium]|nr:type II toxin-antitoxin system MqsR family toxin [Selenomonadaceae bacterium]
MDKFIPTYNLEEFKTSNFKITITASQTAFKLGFDEDDIRELVSTMEDKHFYKSMTSYTNHKIWQDVYHVPYENIIIYVKFTQNVISEFTLLSFKEK